MLPLYKFQTNCKECLYEKKLFGNNRGEMTEHFKGWIDWLDRNVSEYNIYVRSAYTKVIFSLNGKKYKAEWITY